MWHSAFILFTLSFFVSPLTQSSVVTNELATMIASTAVGVMCDEHSLLGLVGRAPASYARSHNAAGARSLGGLLLPQLQDPTQVSAHVHGRVARARLSRFPIPHFLTSSLVRAGFGLDETALAQNVTSSNGSSLSVAESNAFAARYSRLGIHTVWIVPTDATSGTNSL